MTPEERKALTMKLAEGVRKLLKQTSIKANVSCIFYRNSKCLVCVCPNRKELDVLNYWEKACLNSGLEYWLPTWIEHQDEYKEYRECFKAAKISVG